MACIEKNFDQIKSIALYPTGNISIPLPMFSAMDVVSKNDTNLGSSPDKTCTLCRKSGTGNIVVDSMKVASEDALGRPGNVHKVTVEFGTYDITANTLDLLRQLNKPHEAVVTFWNGTQWLLRTDQDAYKKEQKNDGALSITITMMNGQGATVIV